MAIIELTREQYQNHKQNGHVLWECWVGDTVLLNDSDIPQCPVCKTILGVGWNEIWGLFYHAPITTSASGIVVTGCGTFFTGNGRIVTGHEKGGDINRLRWLTGKRFISAWKSLWKQSKF